MPAASVKVTLKGCDELDFIRSNMSSICHACRMDIIFFSLSFHSSFLNEKWGPMRSYEHR